MQALVTDPNGKQFRVHVTPNGDYVNTTFGTFKKDSEGVFRWVVNPDFTLKINEKI